MNADGSNQHLVIPNARQGSWEEVGVMLRKLVTRNPRPRVIATLMLAVALGACGGSGGESPAPNPDANLAGRIVYVLVDGGVGRLLIHTVATRSVVPLGVAGVNPKFSPDGTSIVFQTPNGITVMNSDGSGQRTVSSFGGVPSFDPTGRIVAFGHRDTGVWKVNADGTALTQITNDRGFQPAWSPDGSRIAYSGIGPVAGGVGLQLFIVNADGTNRHQALTSKPINDVVWRPSGKILFGLLVNDNPFDYEIHSYDPTSATSLTRLTTRTGNDFEPSWSPDGQHISWSTVADGLWIMNADGTNQHLVIANARQGSWGK